MRSNTNKQPLNTNRRKILKGMAGTTALSTLGFPAIVSASAPLVVNSYGGAFEKFMRSEIIPDFESSTGIKTLLDINLGKGWLTTLRAAGPDNPPYDVLMTNETWASVERGEGFFEAIPEDKVPNMICIQSLATRTTSPSSECCHRSACCTEPTWSQSRPAGPICGPYRNTAAGLVSILLPTLPAT